MFHFDSAHLHTMRLHRPSLKSLLFGSLGGSLGVVGVLFSIALYLVEILIRPKKRHVFDLYTFSPYELDLPAEVVTFPSYVGEHNITAWYMSREQATTTILLCPGYRTRKADLLGMCSHLWKAGHSVLVFDFYGHGAEVGAQVTLGYREIDDFLGAVKYVKERTPENRLGVVGYSMGAAVAIMSCARSTDVEALVIDSGFATHRSVIEYNIHRTVPIPSAPILWIADYLLWWRAGYRFRQVEPLRDIPRISPRPILIIHGGQDSMVDPKDATLLYGAAGDPKELWIVPEADHCGAYFEDRQAYVKKVIDFFDVHLKNARPRLQAVDNARMPRGSEGNSDQVNPGLPEAS